MARVVAGLDRDEELAFLPLQEEEATELLAEAHPRAERYRTWHLVLPRQRAVGYGAGAPELLLTLRRTRPLGRLLGVVPDDVLDAVYHVMARYRSGLGRFVPDGPAPRRFP